MVDKTMFKQPRKTLCSDNRFTLDALHDRIYSRLTTEQEKNEYLLLVADFFSTYESRYGGCKQESGWKAMREEGKERKKKRY